MESTASIATIELYSMFPAPPPARGPLLSRTNSLPSRVPIKQVRRKTSFVRIIDSSEEIPSPHASIYEAHRAFEDVLKDGATNTKENANSNSNYASQSNRYAIDDAQFLYGQGTVLDTISEKRSNGTMHTLAHTASLNDLDKMGMLGHRDSLTLPKAPRRKQSFSTGDLVFISSSYHKALSAIESTVQVPPPMYRLIYAEPRQPVVDPPHRPETPEGMPSWTQHQSRPGVHARSESRSPRSFRRNIIRRVFGSSSSRLGENGGRSISDPELARRNAIPRYRPPRSIYGPMSVHPFNRAPFAKVSSNFEGSLYVDRPAARVVEVSMNPNPTSRLPKFMNKRKPSQTTPATPPRQQAIPEIRIQSATTIATQRTNPRVRADSPIPPASPLRMDSSSRLDRAPNNTPSRPPISRLDAPVLPPIVSFSSPLRFENTPLVSPTFPALSGASPPAGSARFSSDFNSPASSPTQLCRHRQRHAGFEMQSPDHFSPPTGPEFVLPPVITPWRSRSPSRQSGASGFPDIQAMNAETPPVSVSSRTYLMGVALDSSMSVNSRTHLIGGARDLESSRATSVNSRTGLMPGRWTETPPSEHQGSGSGSEMQLAASEWGGTGRPPTARGSFHLVTSKMDRGPELPGDGCWKCRLDEGVERVRKWVGRCLCVVCCGWSADDEYEGFGESSGIRVVGEGEGVEYGTAKVVRSARGSVVWAGPGTSARETLSGRPIRSHRSAAPSVRSSNSAVTAPAILARNESASATAGLSDSQRRVSAFMPGAWN